MGATIKDRMIEALTSADVDADNASVSRDSEGFWVATVGDVTLRARRGTVEAFAGDKSGRGSDCDTSTDVYTMQKIVQSAIHRRKLARNLIKEIQEWTKLTAWSPDSTSTEEDILVSRATGGEPSVRIYFNGRRDSVIAVPVKYDSSEDRRKISALIYAIADVGN